MMMEVKEELIFFTGSGFRRDCQAVLSISSLCQADCAPQSSGNRNRGFFVLDLLGTVFVCANLPYNFWKYQVAFRTRCCVWSGYFFACSVES